MVCFNAIAQLSQFDLIVLNFLCCFISSFVSPNILFIFGCDCQAFHCNNISECQRLWDNVILSRHGREAEFWLEYANLLRSVPR